MIILITLILKRNPFLMHVRTALLFTLLFITACSGVVPAPESLTPPARKFHDTHSHTLYLFSRARILSHGGNYPAALATLREAIALSPETARLHGEIADIRLKIGQIPEALESINKAIALDPEYRPPYVLGGILMSSAGKDWEAADYLRKAVKIDPAKEDAYLHLALSLTRLFEYEEAVTSLKSLVKLNPESILGYYYLGRTYSQMKLYRDSLGYFKKVLELRPEFDQAVIDMAATYEALGDYQNAIETYRTLAEQDEHRTVVLQRLIQLLLQQRRFNEALVYLGQAAQTGLGGQETLRKTGLVHLELEQYDEAIAVFTKILDKEPAATNIRVYLGIAYEEKGDYDSAYDEFNKIPRNAPQYLDAVNHRALILKEKDQPDVAVALLRETIETHRDNFDLHLNLSTLYESLGNTREALNILIANEQLFLKERRLHFRIGVLLDKMGKRSESIARMKQVLQLDPKDAQALNFIGYSYAEMGINLEEALKYIKQAVALRPRDAFILDSLGWVYFKLKRYDDSIEALEEAVSLVDDDATIIEHLGDVYAARRFTKKALKQYQRAFELTPDRKELVDKMQKLKGEQGEK